MKWTVILILTLAACGNDSGGGPCHYQDHDYALGDTWPAGDNCNDCTCTESGIECTARPCHAAFDADPTLACMPIGTCQSGPPCGSICCGAGEQCTLGTCMCGDQPACGPGDSCEAPGPIGPNGCGSICCGASGPCPR